MTKLAIAATLSVLVAAPLAAQTPAEVEREPLVKLLPGETPVDGECLTEQELDLLARLEALTRPTVGVEGVPGIDDGIGDDPMPFDPHYFIGTWKIEGVIPESALGEAGEFAGTESVRHLSGCTYESTIEATLPTGSLTVTSRMFYDRRMGYLVRLEDDSRGFEFLKAGRVGGDPGGFFSHHWQTPPIESQGVQVQLRGRTFITSPYAYRIQRRISEDGGPFINFGTVWWDREGEPLQR